ncbi:TetR/AcrR family transcriptional regulator [Lapidilactobacillus wuchangensis]|uniref:TetR/AcrR family transcriptional regulator n=1 Tax=Lapidilactobacillus wuchangensis TaxID=2486001 RepID=UPI000F76F07D|nr:TetR/AcrR family transcriptional regulator [Lapidilactobacillus wuchangensis]
MKYDLSKKPTRGAQRTLAAFTKTLFNSIAEKDFAEISVNEICLSSNYPRATFYNYFDDKYDLLNYAWSVLAQQIKVNELQNADQEYLLKAYFSQLYDLFVDQGTFINQIMKHNSYQGSLMQSLIAYLKGEVLELLNNCLLNNPQLSNPKIPLPLQVEQVTNTLILILDWIFLREHPLTKEQAYQSLVLLLQPLGIK